MFLFVITSSGASREEDFHGSALLPFFTVLTHGLSHKPGFTRPPSRTKELGRLKVSTTIDRYPPLGSTAQEELGSWFYLSPLCTLNRPASTSFRSISRPTPHFTPGPLSELSRRWPRSSFPFFDHRDRDQSPAIEAPRPP